MKAIRFTILFLLGSGWLHLLAQNEWTITVKPRSARANAIYLNVGASVPNGTEVYYSGIYLEAGYQKRLNSIISLGPSLSLSRLRSDLGGGSDLRLLTVGADVKFNVIPVMDATKISAYMMIRPMFVSSGDSGSGGLAIGPGLEYRTKSGITLSTSGYYFGTRIAVATDTFTSRGNLKTLVFTLGAAYNF